MYEIRERKGEREKLERVTTTHTHTTIQMKAKPIRELITAREHLLLIAVKSRRHRH